MLPPKYKASHKSLFLLDRCLTLLQIKQIQSRLTVSGTIKDPYAASKIVSFCAISDSGDLSHAYNLFLRLQRRSTFIWNTMIRAFADKNEPMRAFTLYKHMLDSNFLPNNYTFSFLFKACSDFNDLPLALACHGQAIRFGWVSHHFVQNGLLHLFAACGCMNSARKLFDASSNRDVITWTALIHGYLESGQVLIARQLFDEMPEKNAVSWSAMITGYVKVGLFKEALELFNAMNTSGFLPNIASIIGALTACAFLGSLDEGRRIHAYINRKKMEVDRILGAALIDMYSKCGCIERACSIFDELTDRDVYVYTCLISGLANHGQSSSAVQLFERMEEEGVVPNQVTFISVLNACSRMGMVDEGLRVFEKMSKIYGIEAQVQHYGCLVDLLGRAGRLEEARKVLKDMPVVPDSYVLGALLNASMIHNDVELGKQTVERFTQLSLEHQGVHVVLSNMYASTNRWDDVARIRKGMEDKKVRKTPGSSLIAG
ncbi:pentatricopeptide repeat-containing protein At5g66520-like isoform X1 [Euphorbia lathyris]|uniref:pentatricopeptide repeat-containing protein At5g66520-like isoform X1 n=1 Tax=Euphorbia lathyris TaxID=212925 RepID=UPI00331423D7